MDRKNKVIWHRIQKYGLAGVKKIIGIMLGGLLIAVSINALIIPNGLLAGGASGVALLGTYLLHFPVHFGIALINIPLFIWGLKELDRKFIIYSFLGAIILVIGIPLLSPLIPAPKLDLFLAAIFSGVVGGAGIGIILRAGASGGGTDIISLIMKKKFNISVGTFSFAVNMVIMLLSLIFFDLKIVLYSIVSLWVSGKMINFIIEGLNQKRSVMIITEQSEIVAEAIMQDLHRGVTFLEGQGGFSGNSKLVINCVVNNFEIAKVKELVLSLDKKAFLFVTEVAEVSGKGFTR